MLHSLTHHSAMVQLRKPCYADFAKLALRLALGAVFVMHGWGKLHGLEGIGMFFGKLGIPAPSAMALLVACVEFFGGVFVLLGLATRFWAAGLAIVMIIAILTAKNVSALHTYELELSLLAMAVSLFCSGAGAWSLDAMCMKRSAAEHNAAMPTTPSTSSRI